MNPISSANTDTMDREQFRLLRRIGNGMYFKELLKTSIPQSTQSDLNLYPAVLEKNSISGSVSSVGGEPSYYSGYNLSHTDLVTDWHFLLHLSR